MVGAANQLTVRNPVAPANVHHQFDQFPIADGGRINVHPLLLQAHAPTRANLPGCRLNLMKRRVTRFHLRIPQVNFQPRFAGHAVHGARCEF